MLAIYSSEVHEYRYADQTVPDLVTTQDNTLNVGLGFVIAGGEGRSD